MSQSFNKVVLIGRLTDVPQMSTVGENNTSKARMTLAVNNDYSKDAPADFIIVEAWSKVAELMGDTLRKGSLIIVEGQLHVNSFESSKLVDDQGNPGTVYYAFVTVESFGYLEKKDADDSQGGSGARQTTPAQGNANRQAFANRKTNSAGYGNNRRAAGGRR
jgi:single-strand DNA-binding protein